MREGKTVTGLAQFRGLRPRVQGEALVIASRTYEAERNKIARVVYERIKQEVGILGVIDWNKNHGRDFSVRAGL
jgi:hypothetical protein